MIALSKCTSQMGTLESLNVSQEIFFDAPTEISKKEISLQKAKPNISEWRNSLSVEELNAPEKEKIFAQTKSTQNIASKSLIQNQATIINEIIPKEKEEFLSIRAKERSDMSLIFQNSKNITEVIQSNKEGKLRIVKPSKTSIRPKISTKQAVLIKEISFDDKLDEIKLEREKSACINQKITENSSIIIEQNQRLDSLTNYKKLDHYFVLMH